MKILVVDDNRDLASLLKMMLEDEGYEVKSANDGRDGYLTYLFFMPDLIITDIQMPEKNGLELMQTIRVHNPKVRTIYMSSDLSRFRPSLEEERRCHDVSLLKKPFSKIELMELVSQYP